MEYFLKKYKEAHGRSDAPKNDHDNEEKTSREDGATTTPISPGEPPPSPETLVDRWKTASKRASYLSNYRLYQLTEGGNYQVDFPYNGKRVRKTLGTVDRDEAVRRAVELIRAYHDAQGRKSP